MRALVYLRLRLLINSILSVLRNPKQLIVVLIFAAWIALNVFAGILTRYAPAHRHVPSISVPDEYIQLVTIAVTLLLTLYAVERGLNGAAFSFSPGDYDVLFASPISQRLVIATRVLWDAVVVAFWVGVLVVFLAHVVPVNIAPVQTSTPWLVKLWAAAALYAIAVVNLGRIVQLIMAGGEAVLGVSTDVARVAVWTLALASIVLIAYIFAGRNIDPASIAHAIRQPPWNLVLLPALSVASLMTASSPPILGSVTAALALLAVLAAAAVTIVCFLDRDLVEATIEHSLRAARIRAAARKYDMESIRGEQLAKGKGKYRSFVPARGQPALATAYKSVAEMRKGAFLRLSIMVLAALAAAPLAMILPDDRIARYGPVLIITYMLLLAAGVQAMHLRGELRHFSMLRCLPVPPWQQLLGLVVPRALSHSVLVVVALVAFHLGRPIPHPDINMAIAIMAPAMFVAAYLAAAVVTSLFPRTNDPVQRFLSGLVLIVGLTMALTPPALVVGTMIVIRAGGLLAGLLANAALLPIIGLLALLATFAFDRYQPSED